MLKDCIPSYFAKTEQIKELFEAEQPELDAAEEEVESWMKELHIFTAEKTLDLWEDDYKLPHDPSLSVDQRRARIYAKKMERVIPKKKVVEATLKEILNAANVSVTDKDCVLKFFAEDGDIEENLATAIKHLKSIKPSHFDLAGAVAYNAPSKLYIGLAVKRFKRITLKNYTADDPLKGLSWFTDADGEIFLTETEEILIE